MNGDTHQVRRLLAGLRYPGMPEHLAGRIHGALATEAATRADGEGMGQVVVRVARPGLARQAAAARAESKMLHEDVTKLAGQVAETEHAIAETMDRLAAQIPAHAEPLGELSRAARLGARQATALA